MNTVNKRYEWAEGFYSKGIDADAFGTLFEQLAITAGGGGVQPEMVMKAAEEVSSPIHSYFTWDDGQAAREWRINQARALCGGLRKIRVVVESSPDQRKSIRAIVNLDDGRGYHPIQEVLSDSSKRVRLLDLAKKDLRAAKNKLVELQSEAKAAIAAVELAHNEISKLQDQPVLL